MFDVILLDGELETVGEDRKYVVIRRLRELGGGVGIEDLFSLSLENLSSERSYLRSSRSLLMAEEYWLLTAVNSKTSLSRMAAWNAAVKMWILWLVGGGGGP